MKMKNLLMNRDNKNRLIEEVITNEEDEEIIIIHMKLVKCKKHSHIMLNTMNKMILMNRMIRLKIIEEEVEVDIEIIEVEATEEEVIEEEGITEAVIIEIEEEEIMKNIKMKNSMTTITTITRIEDLIKRNIKENDITKRKNR